jgi:hypothetical protein
MASAKKRRLMNENHTFQSTLTTFFILTKEYFLFTLNKLLFAQFLMKISLLKRSILLRQRYETRHPTQLSSLESELIRDKIAQLRNGLAQQKSSFKSSALKSNTTVYGSYVVSQILAKNG